MAKEKNHFALKNFLKTKIGHTNHFYFEHPEDKSFKWEGTAWDKADAMRKARDAYERKNGKKELDEEKASLSLWKHNKRSGLWDHQRTVTSETKDEWLKHFQKDEPEAHFHISKNRPKHNPSIKEDAPTTNISSGNIAGAGFGSQGEPGVRKPARRGKFAGWETFVVSSSTFNSLRNQKRKGKHWRTYLEEDDAYHDLREYAKKCKGPIVVEDERTGACMFVRYGKGGV